MARENIYPPFPIAFTITICSTSPSSPLRLAPSTIEDCHQEMPSCCYFLAFLTSPPRVGSASSHQGSPQAPTPDRPGRESYRRRHRTSSHPRPRHHHHEDCAPGEEWSRILQRLDCIGLSLGLGLVWFVGQVWDESLCLVENCKATSGMSPCGFDRVVRQPFWVERFSRSTSLC
jgi:hypothetical protein